MIIYTTDSSVNYFINLLKSHLVCKISENSELVKAQSDVLFCPTNNSKPRKLFFFLKKDKLMIKDSV